ncbi:MAG: cytochrome c biogenesis protein CcsA [Phycisphaerales bacterium]|nr:cytochrome c biogenesis protein CcsA [Phycisphaerales bacterium]
MKIFYSLLMLVVLLVPVTARADEFSQKVDLATLDALSVQHNQTLKTLDSYARQTLSNIAGRSSLDGQPAVYVILDIIFQPEKYQDRPLIKIKNVPLRKDFQEIDSLDQAERDRILQEGTISLAQFKSPAIQDMLSNAQVTAVWKADAVNQVAYGASQLMELTSGTMGTLKIIAPATNTDADHTWHDINEVIGNMPRVAQVAASASHALPPPLANYEQREPLLETVFLDLSKLRQAWISRDVAGANAAIASLNQTLPQINPQAYPSPLKRRTEVLYNRLTKLTIPGAALYFVAFACFLVAARSNVGKLRLWALRFFFIGFVVHTAGIAIRWWLVEKNVGNWFESIPIKNQFESVMFSAWFGALVALLLELWKGRSIFGAAGSFVGWLSLTAIFATPYVFNREIGGEIGQVNGVLMSYWLYIHVTMVTAAYALIGMSFCLGVWWLVKYLANYSQLRNVAPRQLSADAVGGTESLYTGGRGETISAAQAFAPVSGGGAAVSLGFRQTLAAMLFVPGARRQQATVAAAQSTKAQQIEPALRVRSFLATLDMCNLVVLQLAFWVLGSGIIMGAIWADQSWGRPWGWDPKETFALITWIVYLVVVHVRFVTADKAWWTAVLSILGFFIMLFNWVGVNFFLVGLHSYA